MNIHACVSSVNQILGGKFKLHVTFGFGGLVCCNIVAFRNEIDYFYDIVTCQAHPVLIKKGESSMRFVPFKKIV